MTTAEKFRRRQRIEAGLIMLLGVIMLLQGIKQNSDQNATENCFANKIDQLTTAFTARADINAQDSEVKTRVILGVAQAQSQAEVRIGLDRFIVEQKAINKKRRDNPVPPFPPGKCQDKN